MFFETGLYKPRLWRVLQKYKHYPYRPQCHQEIFLLTKTGEERFVVRCKSAPTMIIAFYHHYASSMSLLLPLIMNQKLGIGLSIFKELISGIILAFFYKLTNHRFVWCYEFTSKSLPVYYIVTASCKDTLKAEFTKDVA